MLILSRHVNEAIKINDDITIRVMDIRKDKVRIGIDAPTKTPVHRYEVWKRIQENTDARTEPLATDGISDNTAERRQLILERLNQSLQSKGGIDDQCCKYLARLARAGTVTFEDIKAVGGSEVARAVHVQKVVEDNSL